MLQLKLLFYLFFLSLVLPAQNTTRLVSPEVKADYSVIFRLKAPSATNVQVVGSWAADLKPVPMTRIDSSTFEVKIGPLPSDLYEYRFKVDSFMMLDPGNGFVTTGGTVVESRVIADADHRALTGFSMGGYQTQNITNKYPNMFKYIGVMSMGLFSSFRNSDANYNKEKHIAQLKALMASKPKCYWIGIGKADFLYETVTKLRSLYDDIGFPYTYRESAGAHNWNEWRLYLTELVPKYFK